MSAKSTVLVCAVVLLAAAGATTVIFSTEPVAHRVAATKETAMLVDVTEVRRGTYRPTLVVMGTVEAARDVILSPRVEGEIVERSPSFTPGGIVARGERLLLIDPSDYENTLARRRSDLRRALADLDVEMGRQDVARQDYELLDQELSPEHEALVLRVPQLETARAAVESERAAVTQAELDVGRTRIEAPFDAHVLSRDVDVGSQVSPGDRLGRIVGVDEYWVIATVPVSRLRWITIPEEPGAVGSPARIRDRAAWPEDASREGTVSSLIGALEGSTRLARVVVTVPDPLALHDDAPGLMIGSFVEVGIEAEPAADVVRLSRDHVRQDDTAWVMEEGHLRIRELTVVLRDEEHAYVSAGLDDGDRVVTTNLSTVVDGAPLRLAETEPDASAAPEDAG